MSFCFDIMDLFAEKCKNGTFELLMQRGGRVGSAPPVTTHEFLLWYCREALVKAHHFRFDPMLQPAHEHLLFAVDLRIKGLFRLPFPSVWYEFSFDPWKWTGDNGLVRVGVLATQAEAAFLSEHGSTQLPACAADRLKRGDDLTMLIGGGFRGKMDGDTLEGVLPPTLLSIEKQGEGVMWKRLFRNPLEDAREDEREFLKDMTPEERAATPPFVRSAIDQITYETHRAVCALTVALMSTDVETEEVPAPLRLNIKREKAGKPPIPSHKMVRLTVGARRKLKQAPAAPGSKASPRMHWRRGHFRTLNTGRVVPVAPTIVNAGGDGGALVKDYAIQGADR